MLPAFRVKGIWPRPAGFRQADGVHPVTGAQLPKFQTTEAILQLPRSKYDELISGHPEYRLKYLDEDKDEITIGSELELSQRLQEPTSHSRLIKPAEHPRFYTSIPECMHAFHLDDNEETRKIWAFFEASTITRNRPAYRLWTSLISDSSEDVLALLNEHAYEFMTGYDFEGFNSHYNYLSEAGKRLKDIAMQRSSMVIEEKPSQPSGEPADTSTSESPADEDSRASQGFLSNADSDVDSQTKNVAVSSAHQQETPGNDWSITTTKSLGMEDINRLRKQSDKTLPETKALLDAEETPSKETNLMEREAVSSDLNITAKEKKEDASALIDQLERQLHMAQSATKLLNNVASFGNSFVENHLNIDKQRDFARQVTKALENLGSLHGSPYISEATPSTITASNNNIGANLGHPVGHHGVSPHQTPSKNDFLTEIGKKASQDAGAKLREQLHGIPKPYNGATASDVRRWVAYSRDPPRPVNAEPKIPAPNSEPEGGDMSTLNKKKSVRFAPTIVVQQTREDITTQQLLKMEEGRGDYAQITSTLKEPKVESVLKAIPELAASPSAGHDVGCPPLTSSELAKLRRIIGVWDAGENSSVAELLKRSTVTPESTAKQAETKFDQQPPEVFPKSVIESPKNETVVESPETTVTKLWCQALEGIICNIRVLADQFETHVQPQIDREQANLDAQLRKQNSSQSLETDVTFFHGVRGVKNLIWLRDTIQQTTNNLRGWAEATQATLDTPYTITDNKICVPRIRSTFDSIVTLKGHIEKPLEIMYKQTFVPVVDHRGIAPQDVLSIGPGYSSETSGMGTPRRLVPLAEKTDRSRSVLPQTNVSQMQSSTAAKFQPPWTRTEALQLHPNLQQTPHPSQHVYTQQIDSNRPFLQSFPPLTPVRTTKMHTGLQSAPILNPYAYQVHPHLATSTQANEKVSTDYSIHHSETEPLLSPSMDDLPQKLKIETSAKVTDRHSANVSFGQSQEKIQPADRLRKTASLPAIRYPSLSEPVVGPAALSVHKGKAPAIRPVSLEVREPSTTMPPTSRPALGTISSRTHEGKPPAVYRHSNPILPYTLATSSSQATTTSESTKMAPNMAAKVFAQASATRTLQEKDTPFPPLPASRSVSPEVFELWEDIPDHADPWTAKKIAKCVSKLRDMGYCKDRTTPRLVVYAQAAAGDVNTAVNIIEEEETALKEQQFRSTDLL